MITDEVNTTKRLYVKSLALLFLFCPVITQLCAYFLLEIYYTIYRLTCVLLDPL